MNLYHTLLPVTLAAMGLIPVQAAAQSAKAPPPTAAATEPAPIPVQRSLVAKDTLFPKALRLQDGRIAAVLRSPANHLSLDGRLDIVFSDDEGRTWTKPALVVHTPLDDRAPAFRTGKGWDAGDRVLPGCELQRTG